MEISARIWYAKKRGKQKGDEKREKLRKYGSDILYYSLSFIATLIAWLAHHLDRIGVLKEADFALELMWWLILMLFVWAGELLPVEEPTTDRRSTGGAGRSLP